MLRAQASVNVAIHKFEVANTNFDDNLNSMHHIIFAIGKENNECYSYPEMLCQDDAKDLDCRARVSLPVGCCPENNDASRDKTHSGCMVF